MVCGLVMYRKVDGVRYYRSLSPLEQSEYVSVEAW